MKTLNHIHTPFLKMISWFKTGGRIYYRKDSERKLFFYLTIAMLIAGIMAKLQIL